MVRTGKRGEGKWKRVSWDEALDYVADELTRIQDTYGKNSVLFSDRGGPFRDFYRAFLRGIGTANYNNHDSACARNVQNAALSVFGFGRKGVSYDLKNAKHIVLQQRNILEAINVAEVNNLFAGLEKGGKLTVIDIRANVPATKADNFFMVRPGTDYAFNLAVINVLINNELYDKQFVADWVEDFDKLVEFVKPYTPEWAEAETGVPAASLIDFCNQLAEAAPSVIWHPGWMTARYSDSFYMTRTIYIINALLGAIGAKGGLPFMNKPGDVGAKGLKSFMELYPKPEGQRADGIGWMEGRKHFDAGPGLVHLAYEAAVEEKPYPIKAYIAQRHDPLMAFPDRDDVMAKWKDIELLVAVTFSWSDTAWNADVVLPISPYLERDEILMTKNGPKPCFQVRKRAIEPVYDTKAVWEIYAGLAKRMGLKELDYTNIEDIWKFQLEGTGVSIEDFEKTGIVSLASDPLYKPVKEGSFKTPSGKVQMIDAKLEADGLPSLKPYEAPERPPDGQVPHHLRPLRPAHPGPHREQLPALRADARERVVDQHQARRGAGHRAGRVRDRGQQRLQVQDQGVRHGLRPPRSGLHDPRFRPRPAVRIPRQGHGRGRQHAHAQGHRQMGPGRRSHRHAGALRLRIQINLPHPHNMKRSASF